MSVLKSVIDVNNGNSGWTKQNLMDAFETALGNLGLHSGSTSTGVPQICVSPTGGSTILYGSESDWDQSNNDDRGDTSWGGVFTHQLVVTEVGTDYRIVRKIGSPNFYAPYYGGMLDQTTDEIIQKRHGLKTGDPVRYLPGETDAVYSLGTNLAPDTLVYIIRTSRDRFKVATSAANATNGIAIDLDGNASTSKTFPFAWIQEAQQASDYINPTIDVYHGDVLEFENVSGNTTNLTVCRDVDSFDNNQRIVYNDPTYGSTPDDETSVSNRSNTENVSCVPGANLTFYTVSYPQSESEPLYPSSLTHPSFIGRPGEDGIRKYIYCSETTGTAKGVINLLPGNVNVAYTSNYSDPYYKYTVPASGGRSELKLRVWRSAYNTNQIRNITIHNIGSGWTDDEVFTIPGELVGGTATTGDIRFGVPTPETSNGANDGIASIKTTTLGGGSNFYQKSGVGAFAVLNVENDATKKYGNTFYSLFLEGSSSSTWELYIQCGNGWEFLNRRGTSSTSITTINEWGAFTGYRGLDKQEYDYMTTSSTYLTLSTNSTPTAYPMQIRTFRAQSPQDTDFAVIQFTQTINEKVEPYATFNFHVGDGYGNGVFDLDEVFLAAYTEYETFPTQGLRISTYMPGYKSGAYSYHSPAKEPVNNYSQARSAYYGYMRGDNNYPYYVQDDYYNNIEEGPGNAASVYYRNSTYDKYDNIAMDSGADYYKPIKTIPISLRMIPCPYYIPDDFVLLQVATTPGLTEFRPGDTVTVSGSEIYEVIQASYQTQQDGLDGVSNNSSEGMLFLARTT